MQHEKLIHSLEEVRGANHLSDDAGRLMQASRAHNTHYAYASMLKRFDAWLNGRSIDDVTIANYLAFLEKSGKAVATARLALAAIRFRARRNGSSRPDGPITASTLEGYGRNNPYLGRGQAQGIEWEQADAMVSLAASQGSLAGLRDAALIAVMSDCLLRISEAAAITLSRIRSEKDGTGRLLIAKSKTDPMGRGTILHLRAWTMRRIAAWTDAANISLGPLFRPVRKGGIVATAALSSGSVRAIIQKWASAAGVTGRVSGHSLRVGSAQSLVSAGATLPELQQAGRWLSPEMPAHYARGQLAGKGAVARLRPDS
ncbi:MAG: tyrosine-type recombinase/integrase [Gammaproteobacteria bacterium]|nr:tyrosine-type recombinase/integrase [Gammaproteobacteria bacterium]MYL00628.1 tyrosine-type recombinase/integrase [Gammaproteobacteria bacterium]